MSQLDALTAKRNALQAEWDALIPAARNLRAIDAAHNEGADGYSLSEATQEQLADKYLPQITAIDRQIFALVWTPDVTTQRRAAWNAEMQALSARGVRMTATVEQEVVAKLGFRLRDLRLAIQINKL